ncbi:glycosyltransferase [Ruegeria arenilitoris]|uniref:glycosyltransferase n=1 Tax=Ruegeria arenilitoris TaxID=1173585 RepID=UPI00147BF52B|nr:glycosyltransferase [Ruegeria arenilitoris]
MRTPTSRTSADVIVCVHNSFDDVKLCLESVLPTLSAEDRLIIVDDGSEAKTKELCESIASNDLDRVLLIRRDKGSGFCRAANEGMRQSDRDTIILLNSDTIVVGDWISKIHNCLHAHPNIGIAGPLSNAGGWQSIPDMPGPNASPNLVKSDPETLQSINKFCAEIAAPFTYPVVEQINGFCLAVKRTVLETVGLFDEVRFPKGYGEENDLNLRAQDAGFLCAVAIDCFVYHAKTKSYSSEQRKQLTENGQVQLRSLYGEQRIRNAVRGTQQNPILLEIRSIARDAFQEKDWTISTSETP